MIHKFLNWLNLGLKKLNKINKKLENQDELVVKVHFEYWDFIFWNWFMVWMMGFLYTFGKENVVTYGHFWKEILYLLIYYLAWPYILGHQGFRLPF